MKIDVQLEQEVREKKLEYFKKQIQLDKILDQYNPKQILVDEDGESGEEIDWVTPKVKSQKTGEMFLDLRLLKKGDRVLQ